MKFQLRVAVVGVALVAQLPCASCGAENAMKPPATQDAADAAGAASEASGDCLADLRAADVKFEQPGATLDVDNPVLIKGPLGAIALQPRGRYAALMDCTLARALLHASTIFEAEGLTRLLFSAAYDHRTRRGSSRMSAHAFGQAIDVHVLNGASGPHDVKEDFEAGVGRWLGIAPAEGALTECIGMPLTERGRRLRSLVCRLKLETELRIIVTPDDNLDHRDHFHLEYAPARAQRMSSAKPEVKPAHEPGGFREIKKVAPRKKVVRRAVKKSTLAKTRKRTPIAKKTAGKTSRSSAAVRKVKRPPGRSTQPPPVPLKRRRAL